MRVSLAIFSISLSFILIGIIWGQRANDGELRECTKHPTIKGRYKTLSRGFGKELQIDVEIKSSDRVDENYIAIAREFRERYCEIQEMRITYFASRKQWEILDPRDPQSIPLAIYYFGKNADQVGLDVYQVINKRVRTRKIDLSNYEDLKK